MPTPKTGYTLADGSPIPGTTTILGRFKESGALLRWAYKQGKDGKELYGERDAAALIGTVTHSMIERYNLGQDPEAAVTEMQAEEKDYTDAMAAMSRKAFKAFVRWKDRSGLEVTHQEILLVSERFKFGGTPDGIAKHGDEYELLDWKTSKGGVYVDHLLQLAAYSILIEENSQAIFGVPDVKLRGIHLCTFSKYNGHFGNHYWDSDDIVIAKRQFLRLRLAYDDDQIIKGLLK